ncbi:hypothetical protein ABB37_01243 [Leptomonas pyrrhocoris]|uniref:3'-5' exonuclease domain-containing protein n=1 Tax=Leptomonas pyrrhocoris TaxID=157538 RepID=A0A0M9G874_LEPPY|nr:hypothetical protein ABB37_01243 [Leptomonas pyrrhocoris]KPA84750.1 hypothetical protein ABB37_01243 [Leptomonas pyrrhocoris]|eukprot:XP_015663189.1 hypothetical protein ABB37_01243 [Leptomonas pyrrhocoris]
MPPSVSSTKSSPTAAVATPEIDLKDVDDVNTHTSESVCSSSGTDADTTGTTHSTHTTLHRCSLTTHSVMAEPARNAARVLGDYARSPRSPTPCGLPEDFAAAACATATVTVPLGCLSPAESPVRAIASPPAVTSGKKTPAPPPPIDFCGPAKPPPRSSDSRLPPPLREKDRIDVVRGVVGDVSVISPVSNRHDAVLPTITPTAVACASPTNAGAENKNGVSSSSDGAVGGALRPPASPSALHAYSAPFHPFAKGLMGVKNRAGFRTNVAGGGPTANLGHSFGLEGSSSVQNTVSPISTPHQGYASSCDYTPMDCHPTPCTIGLCLSDEQHSGLGTSGSLHAPPSIGGMPRRTSSSAQPHHTDFTCTSAGNANPYDVHWQDTGASSCYFSHFTHPASNLDSSLGLGAVGCEDDGLPMNEDGYVYTPLTYSEAGPSHDDHYLHNGVTPSSFVTSGRPERIRGMDGSGGGPWASSVPAMGPDCTLPTYTEPQPPFFCDGPPPPLCTGNPRGDYDYNDDGNAYDDINAVFEGQEMPFDSYIPQDVQRVEHLEDLDYICQGILAEAAEMQRQYQRRCRERQYLAEEAFDDDELDSRMVIALDLEGRSLGRKGSICIITLATYSAVYIIDMVLLGARALNANSALKAVLESNSITKLMFDCRADCDALFFLYRVRLRNVCDLQISSCFALFPMAHHLPGMKDVFRALGLFADEDTDIKDAGRHLFNPKSGGSFDRWEERPLPDILLQYCAVDVKYFFVAKLMLWDHLDQGFSLGEARLASVCAGHFLGCSKGNSLRDFEMH